MIKNKIFTKGKILTGLGLLVGGYTAGTFTGDELYSLKNGLEVEIGKGIKVNEINIPRKGVFKLEGLEQLCGYNSEGQAKIIEKFEVEYVNGRSVPKRIYGEDCTLNN